VRAESVFSRFARGAARWTGQAAAFGLACLTVLVWFVLGPVFHWSDTWQLTINTATTIATTLMVFVIQNTQTRDSEAMQLKLDELILGTRGARNGLIGLEELEEHELRHIEKLYDERGRRSRSRRRLSATIRHAQERHEDEADGRHRSRRTSQRPHARPKPRGERRRRPVGKVQERPPRMPPA